MDSSWQTIKKKKQKSKMIEQYAPERSLQIAPLPKTISKEELESFLREFGMILKSNWTRNSLWIEYLEK